MRLKYIISMSLVYVLCRCGKTIDKTQKIDKKSKTANEDELALVDYYILRSENVAKMKMNATTNPYPHKFVVNTSLVDFHRKYDTLQKNERLDNENVTLAGRVHSIRKSSSKLIFFDLRGEDVKLQVMNNAKQYESIETFKAEVDIIRRGDIIGLTGIPTRTSTGELSIIPTNVSHIALSSSSE